GWPPLPLPRHPPRLSALRRPVGTLCFDRLPRHVVLHALRAILGGLANVLRRITRGFSNLFRAFADSLPRFAGRFPALFGRIAGGLASVFRLLSRFLRILFGGILRPTHCRCPYSAHRNHYTYCYPPRC